MSFKKLTRRCIAYILVIGLALISVVGADAFGQDPSGRPSEVKSNSKKPSRRGGAAKAEPQPLTITLTVLTDPPESAVYLNGEEKGITNAEGKIQFNKLPPGQYSIEVRKDGYNSSTRGFRAGSEAPTLVFKLEPNIEVYLQEFNSLLASGKLIGADKPNALEVMNNLASKYPARPEVARMRSQLSAKLVEATGPVINRTVTHWQTPALHDEIAQANNAAAVALSLSPDDKSAQSRAAFLRGVAALREWQTGKRVASTDGGQGEQASGNTEPIQGGDGLAVARKEFEKALQLEDSWAAANYQLGYVQALGGDIVSAEATFIKVVQIEPRWAVGHNALGAAYSAGGKQKEAIEAFRKAIEIDPSYAAAYAGMGLARARKGDMKEGLKDIERASQLDPNSGLPHLHLGIIYSQSKKSKELAQAQDELKKAIEKNRLNLEFPNRRAEQLLADLQKTKRK